MSKLVQTAFKLEGITLSITSILPLKQLKPTLRTNPKYRQILASIQEVGIIEPLVVFPHKIDPGRYLLVDGHVRLEALKQLGKTEVKCLVSTDDEAYTYNKRVNRIATIQEHLMLVKAIKSGIPEERIARTLRVDVKEVAQRRDLLNGICTEATDLLKHRQLTSGVFGVLKKMKPVRQIEVAELMMASSNCSMPYARALLAATPTAMLLNPESRKAPEALTPEQISRMESEMEALQRDLKQVEDSHGNAVLNLVLAKGYLGKIFANLRIVKYLTHHHDDIFEELRKLVERSSLES